MDQTTDLAQIFIPPPNVTAELGYQLAVTVIEGEPWFEARAVCGMLGIVNPRDAIRRLDDDETVDHGVGTADTLTKKLVSESGLYALVLTSRRPEARRFRRWITSEVLPEIRKTGGYGVRRELTRREILQQALEAEDRAEGLARELEAAAPKVNGYDTLLNADGLYSLATAAQALGLGRGALIALLGELRGIMVRPGHSDHLRPYQDQVHAGRLAVKLRTFDVVKDGQPETRTEGTTMVTPKGIGWLSAALRQRAADRATLRVQQEVTER